MNTMFTSDIEVSLIQKITHLLKEDASGHDIYHLVRVRDMATLIAKSEGGDIAVIRAAALIHDAYRPWEKKTGKSHVGLEALAMMRRMLSDVGLSDNLSQHILDVVALHDVYDSSIRIEDKSIELRVLQDADRLDAMGAIGIGRTFAFGGAHGLEMYVPGETLEFTHDFIESPDHRTSTIAHFYEKLLNLHEQMNTETGKKLGKERHEFMELFLNKFFEEWGVQDSM
jgi:uncharacterized protein